MAALLRLILIIALLLLAAALAVRLLQGARGPALKPWHTHIPGEATAQEIDAMDWPTWLSREEELFAETAHEMAEQLPPEDRLAQNRYWTGSPLNAAHLPRDWNRSFELLPDGAPEGVAVLLHGLTDAPYSMRHLARHYQQRGWAAVAIRLPGHGTVPAALARAKGDDWQAATRLAVREAKARAPGKPLHLVGYSNGAALAVLHALAALDDPSLGQPEALVLVSPMIGLANPAGSSLLARIPAAFPPTVKFSWLDVLPEANPFKYNSFPVRAGLQAVRLTKLLARGMTRAEARGRLQAFPPILAFQSVVDSTVDEKAVVTGLFDRLPENGSELVLFDVNHAAYVGPLLRPAAAGALGRLWPDGPRRYTLRAITNANGASEASAVRTQRPGETTASDEPLDIPYRRDFFSLGHVALPYPLEDGLYGADPDSEDPQGARLGAVAIRGENGALGMPPAMLTRVSSNPFFPWMLQTINQWTNSIRK